MLRTFAFLTCLVCSLAIAEPKNSPAKIAIVIDDIGYRATDKYVLSIPGDITYSILPHTPFGKALAIAANRRNLDVLLHIPMESVNGKLLGPGALTANMNESQMRTSLAESFNEIPFAIGINNHMGSQLTTMYQPMAWTMQYLKDNDLLFLDSVTSSKTQGRKVANEFGVPAMSRHVFLDNNLTKEYIAGQFAELVEKAQKHKLAIAIAHPHPETVAALRALIPTLAKNNVELVSLSSLYPDLETPRQLTASAK